MGRRPVEHDNDAAEVDEGAKDEDGDAADHLDDETETHRGDGVADPVADEDSADDVDTVDAGHKTLDNVNDDGWHRAGDK